MEKQVYVVVSASGFYDHYYEKLEAAFINEKDAEEFAKELDKERTHKPAFDPDFWEEIDRQMQYYEDTHYEEFSNPHRFGTRAYDKWEHGFDKWLANKYLEFALASNKEATLQDIEQQLEYEKHKYDEHRSVKIRIVKLYE